MAANVDVDKRRIIWSMILFVLLLVTVLPAPRAMVFGNPILAGVDAKATEYVDEGLVRASSAFVLARTINAIVSVFEESELQIEPGGIGVSIALGEALDPINDMVERFSWVMLVSVTSLGIQKVLIEIGPWISVEIVLVLGLLLLFAALWVGERLPISLRRIGGSLVLFALLIRFAVPVMAFLNHQAYEAFLETKYVESTYLVEGRIGELKNINPDTLAGEEYAQTAQEEESWWSSATSAFSQTLDQGKNLLDVKSKLVAIKKITFDMFNHLVALIVVFVLNTILLPLLFLWGFLRLGRLLLGQGFGQRMEVFLKEKVVPER